MRVEDLKIKDALDYASGTADRNGAGLDTANAEWVVAIVKFATIAASAVTSIKWQQSDDDGSSDAYSDLEGSAVSVAADDDNQVFALALIKPRKRYVRIVVDKDGSNAAAESATYVLGGNRTLPALASITDEVTVAKLVSPAEGTA